MTNNERQQKHRAKIARYIEALETGHLDIIAKLDGRDKPLANEIRLIAETALGLEPSRPS